MITAATLAVGTEVTDGQITDRNSAWISAKLVEAGVKVIEHRAVADDRPDIERALQELSDRVDLLFVTGGLGPTSDDFTRDLLSSFYKKPLQFDEGSWQQIHEKLGARGIAVREIQKQQCYFPQGARVLVNPAGTANAFAFKTEVGKAHAIGVYALPGPPLEIAAIWEANLEKEIQSLVPQAERDQLLIYRCLGRGESDIAELVEAQIKDSGLRVGYRAHMPYVEVKLWFKRGDRANIQPTLHNVEQTLAKWIVNRDDEDVTDRWIDTVATGKNLRVSDGATGGWLAERLVGKLRERKLTEGALPLTIETSFAAEPSFEPSRRLETWVRLAVDEVRNLWIIRLKTGEGDETVLEESPPYNYKVRSDRGRKYITEKAFAVVSQRL